MRSILIIDDDNALSDITKDMLENYGYEVAQAFSVDEAFEVLTDRRYDLIILDINLPDGTGFEVCEELRSVSNVPVIFASARTSVDDRIIGFEKGGDDYLPKPFSMKELLVRVNALIRRTYGSEEKEEIVSFGDVEVNLTGRSVSKGGAPVSLSLKEFDLLAYLCRNMNTPIQKDKSALDSKNRGSAESRCILRSRIKAFGERLAYRRAIWHNKMRALSKYT